jgi:hypothetical protein
MSFFSRLKLWKKSGKDGAGLSVQDENRSGHNATTTRGAKEAPSKPKWSLTGSKPKVCLSFYYCVHVLFASSQQLHTYSDALSHLKRA